LANGNWKNARGADAALVTQVEAELAALMAVPAAAPVPTPPVAPAPLVPAVTAPVPVPTPPAVPTPPTGASGASPSNAAVITDPFPALMQKIVNATTARQLNQAQVTAILGQSGLTALPQLLSRPDLIPTVEATIDAQITHNVSTGQPV
jgi:hypothetical protein